MNKIIKYSLATMLSFGMSSSCFAIVIPGTSPDPDINVGSVDSFIEADSKKGSPEAETIWVNSVLDPDPDVTFTFKQEENIPYVATDTTDTYAFAFDPLPGDDYFLVKNSTFIALFSNLADKDWGVFNISHIVDATGAVIDMNLGNDTLTISHISRFDAPDGGGGGGGGGTGNSVPEPGMLALFGLGLMGMGLSHIRRKRKTS